MDAAIDAFGEEIGRNIVRSFVDLISLKITPGSILLALVILVIILILTKDRWAPEGGWISKQISIKLCDDPVADKKWKDRVLISLAAICAIWFWVYAHMNY